MFNRSLSQGAGKWVLVAAMLGSSLAMAQSEPTLKQVYETAQTGQLDKAQVMMQQVLVAHPGSAKAHFVQAELSARQGKMSQARDALATAEKLAPGLPFAKSETVMALRNQLSAKTGAAASNAPVNSVQNNRAQATAPAYSAPVTPASSFPWGLALAAGGAAIAFLIFKSRKTTAQTGMPQGAYATAGANTGGLSGPQGFGTGNNGGMGTMAPSYGQQPGYGQTYGQPAASGMGGRVMGGLATGLAVGAGVMAAQAIGKSLMGNENHPAQGDHLANNNGLEPLAGNPDMGGQNFGIADSGSWDDGDALASSDDMGGDWDS